MKNDNSQECTYMGYKLSCIDTDIEAGDAYIKIGCEGDDSFYNINGKPEKTGRVKLMVFQVLKSEHFKGCDEVETFMSADLEDILIFAKKYCTGIYERVNKEVESEKVD